MVQGGMVVGLDLGTTKICAIIAERVAHGGLQIIGVGSSPSEGLRRGVVVDVEKTVQSLKKAVQEAELMAGVEVSSVYAGIAGEHIGSLNSHGVIAIGGEKQEICEADRERVVEVARSIATIPIDQEVLHVLTQEYMVDDQGEIRDPVGMSGLRLEAEVHIVTGAVTSAQNICKSILRADIEVRDIVLEPLASSYAVLEEDEKEIGVCRVDVGGGTTDIALFSQGSVRHTGVIGVGGQNVTNDVAIGLRTSWPHAEKIKCMHGTALSERVEAEDEIEVPGIAGRPALSVPHRELGDIIEPRMEEIFTLVQREIRDLAGVEFLSAGIVLTGGGALLDGAVELAEKVFDMPVRMGLPRVFEGMSEKVSSPIYATALGLVLYGAENRSASNGQHKANGLSEGKFDNVVNRMKEWFQTLV